MTNNEEIVELEPDEQPKSGQWVDVHDVLAAPTEDEAADGQAMGETIAPDDDDDDDDNGIYR